MSIIVYSFYKYRIVLLEFYFVYFVHNRVEMLVQLLNFLEVVGKSHILDYLF
jgi:hypothetical protein